MNITHVHYAITTDPSMLLLDQDLGSLEDDAHGNRDKIYKRDAHKIFKFLEELPSGTIEELTYIIEKKWPVGNV